MSKISVPKTLDFTHHMRLAPLLEQLKFDIRSIHPLTSTASQTSTETISCSDEEVKKTTKSQKGIGYKLRRQYEETCDSPGEIFAK